MPYGTAIYYSKDGNDCIIFKNTLKLQDYRGSKIMTYEVKKYDNVISIETRKQIARRYHRIIEIVNREFWSMDNDTAHGLYVGSYGRGTAIDTSDIDMLVEIPQEQHDRFSAYRWNGQSKFLQAVKDAILTTYPRSDIRADGQVVKVDFREGMKFEVLPAFSNVDWFGKVTYDFPDANMGGHWDLTDPRSEQQAINEKDKSSNGLLRATCKHIRALRAAFDPSYHLSGILIDSFVYEAMCNRYFPNGIRNSPAMLSKTFEQNLLNYYNEKSYYGKVPPFYVNAPGSCASVVAFFM